MTSSTAPTTLVDERVHTSAVTAWNRQVLVAEFDISAVSSTRAVVAYVPLSRGDSWVAMPVGVLTWDRERATIELVYVTEDIQRRRLATRMLEVARAKEPGLKHSTHRSTVGSKWAKSTGDDIPPARQSLSAREAVADGCALLAALGGLGPDDLI